MNTGRKRLGRRDFFKMAAVAAAAGGLPLAGEPLADAMRQAAQIHRRPWWVRQVERPVLGETNEQFDRFSGASIFALYSKLKDEREGVGAFQAEQESKARRITQWIQEGQPGFGLRDRAVYEAGWTVMRSATAGEGILSWTRVRVPTPQDLGVEPYRDTPEEMAKTVKAAARLYGAATVGIAPMNEKYVNKMEGRVPIVFEDVDEPIVSEDKRVIPKKMKSVIAIAVQMDLDLINRVPTAVGSGAATLGYSHCAFVVSTLAEFIRGLGYQAIPSVNDTAQSIPFALDAGLGELARTNRLITPEFGPAVRLAKVFTDMPLAYDKPINFGVAEFCKRCKKCAEACPSQALSLEDEPSFEVKGPWSNPGHKSWFEDAYNCYQYWQEVTTGCSICIAVCPYNKAAEAWIHEVVKATASVVPAADPFFRSMDDAFGYGQQQDPEAWWGQDLPSFGVDTTRHIRR
ncbi:MAG: reductive dehalogenase [Anaerolineae bacterium]